MSVKDYRCDRCQWATTRGTSVASHSFLACRKHPPTRPVDGQSLAYWPVVRDDDFCGQFTPTREEPQP